MSDLFTEKKWKEVQEDLKSKLNTDSYNRWILGITPIKLSVEKCLLGISSNTFGLWLEDNYYDIISESISFVTGFDSVNLFFETVKKKKKSKKKVIKESISSKKSSSERVSKKNIKREKESSAVYVPSGINKRFTFDSFIVGESNKFAHAAAMAVAESPGTAYNPLLICGGTGLGKSHLIQAIARKTVSMNKKAKVEYCTTEELLNSFVSAIQHKSLLKFRKHFRSVDLLLIDDIHFFPGKEKLQEEFFHTFNTLFNNHKQIVMTSDRPPNELKGLQQRLVSRFEWGLTTEVEKPDLETRIAIIRAKQENHNIKIDDELLIYIATRISSQVRRLEGALTRLVCFASLCGQKRITKDVVDKHLSSFFEEEASAHLTVNAIQKHIADHFDIRVTDILSRKRPNNIAIPRKIAMYLSRQLTMHSSTELGEAFGKNHATVLHAVSSVENSMDTDEQFKHTVNRLSRELRTN
ncbi:MAG: chromosomal replication initiator protein DnaA [Verrucomicrobiota bacterium]|nr:chromosomal replication initiator protein DnaA [Verrucomicrobiota bacterium]